MIHRSIVALASFIFLTGCCTPPRAHTTLFREFETELQPGVWHGFALGPSSEKAAYVAKVHPLEPSNDGGFVEKNVVQTEFNGEIWNDVLRLSIPKTQKSLKVQVRVYQISD